MTHLSGRKHRALTFLAAALLPALTLVGAPGAQAQTPPVPEAKSEAPPPVIVPAPPANQNLSQQLYQSNGVIVPPKRIDPLIRKPVPDTGPTSTPIIKPPGSTGGDPSVQPK